MKFESSVTVVNSPRNMGDDFGGKKVGPESSVLTGAVNILQPLSLQRRQGEKLTKRSGSSTNNLENKIIAHLGLLVDISNQLVEEKFRRVSAHSLSIAGSLLTAAEVT